MPPSNESTDAVIQQFLDENDLESDQVLLVLVQTMLNRHLSIQLRRAKLKQPPLLGNARENALVAVMDALYEASQKDAAKTSGSDQQPALSPMPDGAKENIEQKLFRMLTVCQIEAERAAGLNWDDDEPPMMRLVTD